MITIKRSTDANTNVCWVAHSLDKEARRCTQLYLGTDVNGAIAAAVAAGLSRAEATKMAKAEIARRPTNDNIE